MNESEPARKKTVVCLGDSITEAKKDRSYDWVGALSRHPELSDFNFLNMGVGGDLAWNALQRVPAVIAAKPDYVLILIGTNDALASLSRSMGNTLRRGKKLPQHPTYEWFREMLEEIIDTLAAQTSATIALTSLPPLGEDPDSEAYERTALYSAAIKKIALSAEVAYIPLQEEMHKIIKTKPGPAFAKPYSLTMLTLLMRQLFLRKNYDELSERAGYAFFADGIHFNSRGGAIAENLFFQFLAEQETKNSDTPSLS